MSYEEDIAVRDIAIAVATQSAAFKICHQPRKFFIKNALCQVKHLCTNWQKFKTFHIDAVKAKETLS